MTEQWSVAQIFSKRAHRITAEIQEGGKGVYQPSYERHWISGGKPSSRQTALMPGYLFFVADGFPPKDARGRDIEGVIRVLGGLVRHDEYQRMRLECDLRKHDDAPPEVISTEPRRRRRPRRSKRAKSRPGPIVRAKMRAARECA